MITHSRSVCLVAVAAAMGVPASVIFEGKFSSNSMSQLQLLNSTIQNIALSVNKVLSRSGLEGFPSRLALFF